MPIYVDDYTAILGGGGWSGEPGTPAVVTYSFADVPARRWTEDPGDGAAIQSTFRAFGSGHMDVARLGLARWAEASGIRFVEVAEGEGDIVFFSYDFTAGTDHVTNSGWAYYPGRDTWTTDYGSGSFGGALAGDIAINSGRLDSSGLLDTIMHEIGHAIGLKHPFSGDIRIEPALDTYVNTLMSYDDGPDDAQLGILDRDASRYLYGPSDFVASTSGGIEHFTLQAAAGRTVQVWGHAASRIFGSSLRDDITAGAGDDMVVGFEGDDTLRDGVGNDTLIGGQGNDRIIGGPGNDRLVGDKASFGDPDGSDTADYSASSTDIEVTLGNAFWTGSAWVNLIGADVGQDELDGFENILTGRGNDTITGNARDNLIRGGAGNDTVNAEDGEDTVFGGDGSDQLLGGPQADALVGGSGSDHLSGGTGNDILIGDEHGLFHIPESASIFRLYRAVFGRDPDLNGHQHWTRAVAIGQMTLFDVTTSFVAAQEFQLRYGDVTNVQFLTLLYRNVLDREPDAKGLASWLDLLDNGTPRARAVTLFSESPEHQNKTVQALAAFEEGGDITTWADDVYRLYVAIFDREPDSGGFLSWTADLATGRQSFPDVIRSFMSSPEFQLTYGGATDNAAFVTLLYNNVLKRAPEPGGLAGWLSRMDDGMSREDVVAQFMASAEFIANTRAALVAYGRDFGETDVIEPGAGDALVSGGALSDVFVFTRDDNASTVTVTDLEIWDVLDFRDFGQSRQGVLDAMTQQGDDVVFVSGGETIVFAATQLAEIEQGVTILV